MRLPLYLDLDNNENDELEHTATGRRTPRRKRKTLPLHRPPPVLGAPCRHHSTSFHWSRSADRHGLLPLLFLLLSRFLSPCFLLLTAETR
jgi:hypothetical protein